MKKFILTTLLASMFFSNVNSQFYRASQKRIQIEPQMSVGVKSAEEKDDFVIDFCLDSKYRISRKVLLGAYANFSPEVSSPNYPWGFGFSTSIKDMQEFSDLEFKLGAERNPRKNFSPTFSITGTKEIFPKGYIGGQIKLNSDLVFELKGLIKYVFHK